MADATSGFGKTQADRRAKAYVDDIAALLTRLGPVGDTPPPADGMAALIEARLDRPPLPGRGRTLDRWRALSAVAHHDLELGLRYESHADAIAILAEFGQPTPERGTQWAVWGRETAGMQATIRQRDDSRIVMAGAKADCRGAAEASHALLTVWEGSIGPWLAQLTMRQPAVTLTAAAAADVPDADVGYLPGIRLDGARGQIVGPLRSYHTRPGYWHGAAGETACWFGAATRLTEALRSGVRRTPGVALQQQLGSCDMALNAAAALLQHTAQLVDHDPHADARIPALRLRVALAATAGMVLSATAPVLEQTSTEPALSGFRRAHAALDLALARADIDDDRSMLGEAVEPLIASWRF